MTAELIDHHEFQEWFTQVVHDHSAVVFASAYAIVRDFDEAEDIAQDAFIRAWERKESLNDRKKVAPWLCQIARNCALSKKRKKSEKIWDRSVPLEVGDAESHTSSFPSPGEAVVQKEEAEILGLALAKIPERYRLPLILFHFEEIKAPEIAETLGLSHDAVRKRLSRGRSMLHDDLQDRLRDELHRRKPGRKFAASVMAAIAAGTASSAAASIAGGGSAGMMTLMVGGTVALIVIVMIFVVPLVNWGSSDSSGTGITTPLGGVEFVGEETDSDDGHEDSLSGLARNKGSSQLDDEGGTASSIGNSNQFEKNITLQIEEPNGSVSNNASVFSNDELLGTQASRNTLVSIGFQKDEVKKIYAETKYGIANLELAEADLKDQSTKVLRVQNLTEIKGTVFDIDAGSPVVGLEIIGLITLPSDSLTLEANEDETQGYTKECKDCFDLQNLETLPSRFAANLETTKLLGSAITDENGEYSFTPSQAGSVFVLPRITSESTLKMPEHEHLAFLPNQGTIYADFDLEAGEILTGSIKNVDGEPISNAVIMSFVNNVSGSVQTFSDEQGRFALSGLAKDELLDYVGVSHPDYENWNGQNIDPLAGDLDITLEYALKLVLKAVDGENGKPIPHFRYQFLFETYNGWNPDTSVPPATVENPEGTVDLSGFQGRTIKALVKELGFNGEPTGRIGAGKIDIEFTKETKVYEVNIYPAGKLEGRVVLANGMTPVTNVTVGFEKMSAYTHHRVLVAEEGFEHQDNVTDSAGRFTISPAFPGEYIVRVDSPDYGTPEPIRVKINEGESLTRLEIKLDASGEIFGQAQWSDGEPVSGIPIVASGAHEELNFHINRTVISNDKGEFIFESLPNASWTIELLGNDVPANQRKHNYFIKDQESVEANIVIDRPVEVIVELENSGTQNSSGIELFMVKRGGGSRIQLHEGRSLFGNGKYKAMVPPGYYAVSVGRRVGLFYFNVVGNLSGSVIKELRIQPQPQKQNFKLNFELSSADVMIESDNLQSTQIGFLEVDQMLSDGSIQPMVFHHKITGNRSTYEQIVPGTYKVRYRATNGNLTGESEWTEISADERGLFVVLMDEKPWQLIDTWAAGSLDAVNDQIVRRYPLSQISPVSGGTVEVMFDYLTGHHGVQTERVSIVRGSTIISEDRHIGWSGGSEIEAVYQLQIPANMSLNGLELEIEMLSSTGSDTNGKIYAR